MNECGEDDDGGNGGVEKDSIRSFILPARLEDDEGLIWFRCSLLDLSRLDCPGLIFFPFSILRALALAACICTHLSGNLSGSRPLQLPTAIQIFPCVSLHVQSGSMCLLCISGPHP